MTLTDFISLFKNSDNTLLLPISCKAFYYHFRYFISSLQHKHRQKQATDSQAMSRRYPYEHRHDHKRHNGSVSLGWAATLLAILCYNYESYKRIEREDRHSRPSSRNRHHHQHDHGRSRDRLSHGYYVEPRRRSAHRSSRHDDCIGDGSRRRGHHNDDGWYLNTGRGMTFDEVVWKHSH